LIGVLGWGYFAVGAAAALDLRSAWRYAAVLLIGPIAAHALILSSWWLLFRWTLRGEHGSASVVGIALMGLAAAALVLRARRAGRVVPMAITGPRMTAALLFLALFVLYGRDDWRVWTHVIAISLAQMASSFGAPWGLAPTRAR